MPQKSNLRGELEPPVSSKGEEQEDSDLSLVAHDKQPFYLRLLQRDNSSRGSSSRRIRLAPNLVPFLWESSPGLAKPNWLSLNSDHQVFHELHDNDISSLAPPPILQQHHMYGFTSPSGRPDCLSDSFASTCSQPELRSADDSWLCSHIKTAFRRRRSRRASSLSSSHELLMGSAGRGEISSPRSTLDGQGHLGSSSSSDSERYRGPGSAKNLRESKLGSHFPNNSSTYKPIDQLSLRLNKKNMSTKIKGCCCFQIPDCEL